LRAKTFIAPMKVFNWEIKRYKERLTAHNTKYEKSRYGDEANYSNYRIF